MTRIVGGQLELAAVTSTDDSSDAVMRATFPRSLQSRGTHAQAIRDRAPVNIAHRHTDPRVSEVSRATGRLDPYQSVIDPHTDRRMRGVPGDPPYRPGMDRRRFLLTSLPVVLAVPRAAGAQQSARSPRVGVLRPGNPPPDDLGQREAFEVGLRDLGWTPGTNILIEYRYAEGKPERLSELAAELVRLPVDVIVASASTGARAAQQATRTIPIVMSTLPDPVGQGLVASVARPGGNTTGLDLDSKELTGKQLQLLKETVPRLSSIAVLRNRSFRYDAQTEAAAAALKLKVKDFPVSHARDLAPTFAAMSQARVGAILVQRDPAVIERKLAEVVALAAQQRLPALYFFHQFPDSGGLMSYGANVNDIHRRSAAFVDKILKGWKPADLPVEQPTKFELVVNLKTAKALGLTIPSSVLARADQVID
jgi:putative ABC transport system substrate-binding protein